MTQDQEVKKEQLEEVREVKEKVEQLASTTDDAGRTLMSALSGVERALTDAQALLKEATYRATDAQTVIQLMKSQITTLRSKVGKAEQHAEERVAH